MLQKLKEADIEETSELLTQFGEGCVDRVSIQIDRIEEDLKVGSVLYHYKPLPFCTELCQSG